jgi:hypothetical protein
MILNGSEMFRLPHLVLAEQSPPCTLAGAAAASISINDYTAKTGETKLGSIRAWQLNKVSTNSTREEQGRLDSF